MITSDFAVSGMSCDHCVQAVTTEVGKLAGVTDVTADLSTGTVTVTRDARLDEEAVRDAVDEAGYELVS